MSMNYLVADLLARLRNGQQARLATVRCQGTKLLKGVLEVLKNEGYIENYSEVDAETGKPEFEIELKYYEGQPVIKDIKCISKPGRRVYAQIGKLQKFYNGLGIAILSTSKGIMSDYDAHQANVGGEILCSVF